MKFLAGTLFFMVISFLSASAQEEQSAKLITQLRTLLTAPSEAQPVSCSEEENKFDRIKLENGKLQLIKNIEFNQSRTELVYTIDLRKLSTRTFDYDESTCHSEIVLFSRLDKAFEFNKTKYIANRLTENIKYFESQIRFKVFKRSDREIINTIFRLAGYYR